MTQKSATTSVDRPPFPQFTREAAERQRNCSMYGVPENKDQHLRSCPQGDASFKQLLWPIGGHHKKSQPHRHTAFSSSAPNHSGSTNEVSVSHVRDTEHAS
jgi:hypothetical protein